MREALLMFGDQPIGFVNPAPSRIWGQLPGYAPSRVGRYSNPLAGRIILRPVR
jgi:hypothetical protein